MRLAPPTYRRITFVALVALVAIVVTGAAVRLTGSGLGCSDWPGCHDERFVPAADVHGWVEFGNRLVTGVVSLAVVVAVLGSRWRTPRRRDLTWWSWSLVAGVVAQVALGAVTVITHLSPLIVMGHFLLSMILVLCAVVLHHRAGLPDDVADRHHRFPASGPDRLVVGVGLLAAAAVVTGTIVTATGPHGGSEDVERLGLDLPDVARLHGATVIVLLVTTVALVIWEGRRSGPGPVLRAAEVLLALLFVQGGIGYVQYFNGVPAALVALHVTGATLLWVAAVHLTLAARQAAPVATASTQPALSSAG